jgi:organic radical activating enzyme
MPKGINNEELAKNIKLAMKYANEYGCNISPRMHIAYGLK